MRLNLAGGLFSSEDPQMSKPLGRPTATYHIHLETFMFGPFKAVVAPDAAVPAGCPPNCASLSVAWALRAARNAARSVSEMSRRTGRTTAESHRLAVYCLDFSMRRVDIDSIVNAWSGGKYFCIYLLVSYGRVPYSAEDCAAVLPAFEDFARRRLSRFYFCVVVSTARF